jgi:peptidoglycan/xylan/chitin deacetylase (PgdA/CDA1 family)
MNNPIRPGCSNATLVLAFLALTQISLAQRVAITFDDLLVNGGLPPNMTQGEAVGNTLAILKMRHVPAAYGFVNAKKLEANADAAAALKLWADAEPAGNHTYSHMDLNANPAEAFEREIEADEPVLELVAAKDAHWHWLRSARRLGTSLTRPSKDS